MALSPPLTPHRTPFHSIPLGTFLQRILWPSLGLFMILWVGVGIFGRAVERFSEPHMILPFWEASWKLDQEALYDSQHIPQVCLSNENIQPFQAQQCYDFWKRLILLDTLAVSPLLLTLLSGLVGIALLSHAYHRAQHKAHHGKADLGGTLNQVLDAPEDSYSRFYCLRPCIIKLSEPSKSSNSSKLSSRNQFKIYMPLHTPYPQPGEKIALFQIETALGLGEKRYWGIPYTPHVAIIRGS